MEQNHRKIEKWRSVYPQGIIQNKYKNGKDWEGHILKEKQNFTHCTYKLAELRERRTNFHLLKIPQIWNKIMKI